MRIIIILGLAIVLTVLFLITLDKCSAPPKTQIVFDSTVIKLNKVMIDSLNDRIQATKKKMTSDSVLFSVREKAFKIENNRLRRKLAESRIEIQPMIDSIPVLNEFVDTQDSLILVQSARIDTLEQEKERQRVGFSDLLEASEGRFKAISETNTDLSQQLTKSISETQRLQRKEKKRFSVGPHVGYGFRGVDVGISVQYSLFRF